MRRYHIVSGILLILSIIDFALAAPVLVQEKRQASADVVHIPKDVITVLWERGDEKGYLELMKEIEEKIKALTDYFGSVSQSSVTHASPSAAPLGPDHASSSAAPPGPDHGSTSVVQLPAPNPASSEAHAPQPNLNPNKRPWTDTGPSFDGHDSVISEDNPPKRQALPKESGQAHESEVVDVHSSGSSSSELPKDFGQADQYQIGHVQQTNPGPSADPDFDRLNWMNVESPPPLSLAPPTRKPLSPSPSNAWPSNPGPSNPGPSNPGPSNPGPSNPGPSNPRRPILTWLKLRPPETSDFEVFQGPSPTQELPDSELHYGLSSTDSDSEEAVLQASTYAEKGKAKQLRRNSDTARDVANAAQRESRLQPTAAY